ncbi:MAG: hypothetical protein HY044_00365 [Candidatus Woesebacteria bacterium]|nr:MAG: hypothetical protein HY044_00365 [Candidatus Woesebacteria bacterium]
MTYMGERIVFYDRNFEFPTNKRLLYVVAKNGNFLWGCIKQGDETWIEIVAPTNRKIIESCQPEDLLNFEQKIYTSFSKIPYGLILMAKGFFRKVYEKFQSEAMLQILYSPEEDKWDFRPLHQKVSFASVQHREIEPIPEGFLAVGIIHSHGIMLAGHSLEDDFNETGVDGIYITLGRVFDGPVNMSVSVTICGLRFILSPDFLIDMPDQISYFPEDWLWYVRRGENQ